MGSAAGRVDVVLLAPLCIDEVVTEGQPIELLPGGAGFYAAWALAGRGVRVRLHTPLASRDEGLLGALPEGIEVTLHPSKGTSRFRIQTSRRRPDERILSSLEAADPLDPDRIVDWEDASHFLFAPLLPSDLDEDLRRFLLCIGKPLDLGVQGLVRSIDSDGRVSRVEEMPSPGLLPLRVLAGDEAEIGICEGLIEAEERIVTRGSRGATIHLAAREETLVVDPVVPQRPIRHPIGLGDTFLAVYGLQRSLGADPAAAGRSAARAATRRLEEGPPGPILSL